MNVLFISNLFPNNKEINIATFNRQQINCLKNHCNIDVIAPVPWTKIARMGKVSYKELIDNVNVYHPTYYYIPKILRGLQGLSFYISIYPVARKLFKTRRYDIIYASWLYPDGLAAAFLSKKYSVPLFIQVLGTDVNRLENNNNIISKLSIKAINRTAKVICVSKALCEKLKNIGIEDNKITVIYNGVDKNIFYPIAKEVARKSLGLAQDIKILLYVGRLVKEKGLRELLQAYACIKESDDFGKYRLFLIGSGPFKDSMEKIISSQSSIKDVVFLGSLNLESVSIWMNASDIVCLPSYNEGLPNTINEALACNKKVIASSVGGIPELMVDNGLLHLVEPRNHMELYNSIRLVALQDCNEYNLPILNSWESHAKTVSELFRLQLKP